MSKYKRINLETHHRNPSGSKNYRTSSNIQSLPKHKTMNLSMNRVRTNKQQINNKSRFDRFIGDLSQNKGRYIARKSKNNIYTPNTNLVDSMFITNRSMRSPFDKYQ